MKKCKLCGQEATMYLSPGGVGLNICGVCWDRVTKEIHRPGDRGCLTGRLRYFPASD